jgi:hypothetical protein
MIMEITLRFFKVWICLIPALIFWVISHPLNIVFACIPEGLYWIITAGRSMMDDGRSFIDWVFKL